MNLEILRVRNTEDGGSELVTEATSMVPASGSVQTHPMVMSAAESCKRYYFVRLPAGFSDKQALAGRRQLCVLLSGQVEVGTSDGQTVELGAGETIFLEDTEYSAPKRSIKVLGDEAALVLAVQLE